MHRTHSLPPFFILYSVTWKIIHNFLGTFWLTQGWDICPIINSILSDYVKSDKRDTWWVLWENWPVQCSKQGCTYLIMVEMMSGISNRGVNHERWSNLWLFWYQIYEGTSNNFYDQKFANEQVYFRLTLVTYG